MSLSRLVVLALIAAACGGDGGYPTMGGGGGGGNLTPNTVTVGNDFFNPPSLTVGTGTTITWNWNSAGVFHNVTFEDGNNSASTMGSGSHQRTFGSPGTYRYRCTLHSPDFTTGMAGQVTVQ